MAYSVTRYRQNNPGQNSRFFDITAIDADTATTFAHNCGWTPDDWNLQATDGTACLYTGEWRAQVSASNVTVTKTPGAGSGGAIRLALNHAAVRF